MGDGGRLLRALHTGRQALADPIEAWLRVREQFVVRRERSRPLPTYEVEPEWERHLHELIGAPWPCPEAAEFRQLWSEVVGALQRRGLEVGVGFFAGWNDGDPEMVRAAWCLTRHLRPMKVVETGVGRGLTTRLILEALERNGAGHLWSVDLPQFLNPALNEQVGIAVEGPCRGRWSYIPGSSRRRLPGLLASVGQIELFVHDSRHTEYNTRFELDQAFRSLRPGGMAVVDDIDLNGAFKSFLEHHPRYDALACPALPPQPDTRRPNERGLFGVIRKPTLSCQ